MREVTNVNLATSTIRMITRISGIPRIVHVPIDPNAVIEEPQDKRMQDPAPAKSEYNYKTGKLYSSGTDVSQLK